MIKLIKNIFLDIFLLYKNFLHFNLSKIVIYAVSILYTIIFSIPFILFFAFIYYKFGDNIYNIVNSVGYLISSLIIGILAFFVLIIVFSYNYVLLTKLNFSYLEGKKLKISKNYYFDFKLFCVFFKTLALNFLILLIPFLIGAILIGVLILFSGGIDNISNIVSNGTMNYFSIISLIISIFVLISFIYLLYRTLFTIIILVDKYEEKKLKNPLYYIKKSFKKTKGIKVFFKLIILFILVGIFSLPISFPLQYYSNLNDKISDYMNIQMNPDLAKNLDFYYLEDLKQEFGDYDLNDLYLKYTRNFKIYLFLEVLNFLFIVGLYEMFLVSFYKRELKK